MASSVEQLLANVQAAGGDIQEFADALAAKIQQGGNLAVRASNATTGAAVGAKAGSTVPVAPLSTNAKIALGVGAFLLLRKLL